MWGLNQVQGRTNLKRVNWFDPVTGYLSTKRIDDREHPFRESQDWYISSYCHCFGVDDVIPTPGFGDRIKENNPVVFL
jgi:hypothetical protein